MELTLQPADPRFAIQRFDSKSVTANGTRFTSGVILGYNTEPTAWNPRSLADLQMLHIDTLLALQPELVLFGSGRAQGFLAPEMIVRLNRQGVGCEAMTTAAACRTFNVLLSEGRRVVAALIFDSETQ